MIVHVVGRVPVYEQPVTQDLCDHTLVHMHDALHHGEVPREHEKQLHLAKLLRHLSEVLNVGAEDRNLTLFHLNVPPMNQDAHHGLRHEPRKSLYAAREAAKRMLQVGHVGDSAAAPELAGLREVEIAKALREVGELAQTARDVEAEAGTQARAEQQHNQCQDHSTATGLGDLYVGGPLDLLNLNGRVRCDVGGLLGECACGQHQHHQPRGVIVEADRDGADLPALAPMRELAKLPVAVRSWLEDLLHVVGFEREILVILQACVAPRGEAMQDRLGRRHDGGTREVLGMGEFAQTSDARDPRASV
mmetsp:Transcript_71604/g.193589  ORF Transcript_71604/g.193589 Transcript_71604/m.193589 type:complete len:305 (-) Transcript_71604:669-1583(-)